MSFHTPRKAGANTFSILSLRRNYDNYNDVQQKHKKICAPAGETDFFDFVNGDL